MSNCCVSHPSDADVWPSVSPHLQQSDRSRYCTDSLSIRGTEGQETRVPETQPAVAYSLFPFPALHSFTHSLTQCHPSSTHTHPPTPTGLLSVLACWSSQSNLHWHESVSHDRRRIKELACLHRDVSCSTWWS